MHFFLFLFIFFEVCFCLIHCNKVGVGWQERIWALKRFLRSTKAKRPETYSRPLSKTSDYYPFQTSRRTKFWLRSQILLNWLQFVHNTNVTITGCISDSLYAEKNDPCPLPDNSHLEYQSIQMSLSRS